MCKVRSGKTLEKSNLWLLHIISIIICKCNNCLCIRKEKSFLFFVKITNVSRETYKKIKKFLKNNRNNVCENFDIDEYFGRHKGFTFENITEEEFEKMKEVQNEKR